MGLTFPALAEKVLGDIMLEVNVCPMIILVVWKFFYHNVKITMDSWGAMLASAEILELIFVKHFQTTLEAINENVFTFSWRWYQINKPYFLSAIHKFEQQERT